MSCRRGFCEALDSDSGSCRSRPAEGDRPEQWPPGACPVKTLSYRGGAPARGGGEGRGLTDSFSENQSQCPVQGPGPSLPPATRGLQAPTLPDLRQPGPCCSHSTLSGSWAPVSPIIMRVTETKDLLKQLEEEDRAAPHPGEARHCRQCGPEPPGQETASSGGAQATIPSPWWGLWPLVAPHFPASSPLAVSQVALPPCSPQRAVCTGAAKIRTGGLGQRPQ